MTWPASRPEPRPDAEGWRVEIPMPCFHDGRQKGKPVDWLSLNKIPASRADAIKHWQAAKTWRLAARDAFRRHRIPKGLDLIYLTVEFRFATNRHRDPSNFELTVKHCIDALQPEKTGKRKSPRTGKTEPFVDYGWGVIPNDTPQHLIRGPEMPVGPVLPKGSTVKGLIIFHIVPMTREPLPL